MAKIRRNESNEEEILMKLKWLEVNELQNNLMISVRVTKCINIDERIVAHVS